jgi:outer membrane lipoprotein LolB
LTAKRLGARRSAAAACAIAIFFVAGCAQNPLAKPLFDAPTQQWSGRISLQTQGDPPQAFFAAFALEGSAERGELSLTSPLGTTLAAVSWAPGRAQLASGKQTQTFPSLGQALAQATGSELPIAALFDWLGNTNTAVSGWTADLSGHAAGRLSAARTSPEPRVEMRIVLDK